MKTAAAVLRKRREERRALERSMLRAMRHACLNYSEPGPGRLTTSDQATLWGLEKARRNVR